MSTFDLVCFVVAGALVVATAAFRYLTLRKSQ